jgi:predicted PurR-regulated permease PerM
MILLVGAPRACAKSFIVSGREPPFDGTVTVVLLRTGFYIRASARWYRPFPPQLGSPTTLQCTLDVFVESSPAARIATTLVILAAGAWLLEWAWAIAQQFADIILLFVLGWLISFLLEPLCIRLERAGLSRAPAVGTVYLGVVITLVGVVALGVPILVAQTLQLSESLPELTSDLQRRADDVKGVLIAQGIGEATLLDATRAAVARAESLAAVVVGNALSVATTVAGSIARTLLILLFAFYMSVDGGRFAEAIRHLAPSRFRHDIDSGLHQIDRTFGGYVRSLLIQAVVYGVGNAIVMAIAGLPFILVLSTFGGVAMMLPVIGPVLALAPPILLAVLVDPSRLWWVVPLLLALQVAVANVLATRLMSRAVGVHPLVVFGAVLVGGRVAGVWGGILGIPVAALLATFGRVVFERIVRKSTLFRSGTYAAVAESVDPNPIDPT